MTEHRTTPPERPVRLCPEMLGPWHREGRFGRLSLSVGCGYPLNEDGTCTNPNHPPGPRHQERPMIEPVSDAFAQFDDIDAWLADVEAPGVPEALQPAADAFFVLQEAIARADAHQGCPKDGRDFTFLLGLTGTDEKPTIQTLAPEDAGNAHCVLGELRRMTDRVTELRIVGVEMSEPEAKQ